MRRQAPAKTSRRSDTTLVGTSEPQPALQPYGNAAANDALADQGTSSEPSVLELAGARPGVRPGSPRQTPYDDLDEGRRSHRREKRKREDMLADARRESERGRFVHAPPTMASVDLTRDLTSQFERGNQHLDGRDHSFTLGVSEHSGGRSVAVSGGERRARRLERMVRLPRDASFVRNDKAVERHHPRQCAAIKLHWDAPRRERARLPAIETWQRPHHDDRVNPCPVHAGDNGHGSLMDSCADCRREAPRGFPSDALVHERKKARFRRGRRPEAYSGGGGSSGGSVSSSEERT